MKNLIFVVLLVVGALVQARPLIQMVSPESHSLSPDSSDETQNLTYYFGRVPVNTRQIVTYTVTNTSATKDLNIDRVTIGGMFFDAETDCPGVLKPGKKCFTDISYWPSFEGSHHGELVWYTSDGAIDLSLWGEAYRF
jgi:hypothetical protein